MQFPYGPSVHLIREGETFEDPRRYRRLVEKLNCLTVTHHDIACFVLISMPNSIPKRRNYGRLAL